MAEVTEADRAAAAALAREIGEHEIAANILAGIRDPYVWVQAFAAHREAAEKAERQAVVGWLRGHECQLYVPDGMPEPFDEAADAIERGDHRKGRSHDHP